MIVEEADREPVRNGVIFVSGCPLEVAYSSVLPSGEYHSCSLGLLKLSEGFTYLAHGDCRPLGEEETVQGH